MKLGWLPVYSTLFTLFAQHAAAAAEAKCFPTCRSGFVCSPQAQCLSACNPACGAEEICTDQGECVHSTAGRPRPREDGETERAIPREPRRPIGTESPSSQVPDVKASNANYVAVGGTAVVGKGSIGGLTVAAGHAFGETHGFLLGLRTGVYFGGGETAPLVGLDLGYRGWFVQGTTRAGVFAVGQFQGYIASPALVFGGFAVGPMVEFGSLHLQLPLGAGIAAGGGGSLAVGQFGLLGGISL